MSNLKRYNIGSLPCSNGFMVALVEQEFGKYVKFDDINKAEIAPAETTERRSVIMWPFKRKVKLENDDLKQLIVMFKKIQNDNDIAINCIMDHLHVRLVKDDTKPFGYRCIEVP